MTVPRTITITVEEGENYPAQVKRRLGEHRITHREMCAAMDMEEGQFSRLLNQPSKSHGGPPSPRLDTVVKIEAAILDILEWRRRGMRDREIEEIVRWLAHAPPADGLTIAPGLIGWRTPGGNFLCARCAARIFARGGTVPKHSNPVWHDSPPPADACVGHMVRKP